MLTIVRVFTIQTAINNKKIQIIKKNQQKKPKTVKFKSLNTFNKSFKH